MKLDGMSYETAKRKLDEFLNDEPLALQKLDRETLEEQAASKPRNSKRGGPTLQQLCVDYLRHRASAYEEILRKLHKPDCLCAQAIPPHILHVERRRAIAIVKKRVLDEIAAMYPWLQAECTRQKSRDGVEDEPGEFVLPFGPFNGYKLREIDADYLLQLLGQSFVRRSFRTRIERHLAERYQQVGSGSQPSLAS